MYSVYVADFRLTLREYKGKMFVACKKPKFKQLKAHISTCVPPHPSKDEATPAEVVDEMLHTSMVLTQMPEKMETPEEENQCKHFLVQRDDVLTIMASDEELGKGSKTDSELIYQALVEYAVCGLSYDFYNGNGT